MQLQRQDPAVTAVLQSYPDPAWTVDGQGLVAGWNRAAENLFGWTSSEVLGRCPRELLGLAPGGTGVQELRDAHSRPVHGTVISWAAGSHQHHALRVSTGDAGMVSRRLLEGLLEHVSDAIITVDPDGIVLSLNKGAERIYGVSAAETVGRHVDRVSRYDGAHEYLDSMRTALVAGGAWEGVEVQITTHAGRQVLIDTAATGLFDLAGTYCGAVLVSRDVTPVRELEQSLRAATRALRDRATQMAKATHRDALTGVAARSLLQERLASALAAAVDSDEPVCVLAADLDGFRAVNDSYGLATGDAILISFAAHLRSALPPSATAGRLGADEFAVVLPAVEVEEAERIARLVRSWTPPTPLPSRGRRTDDPDVGVTVGVVRATSLECRSPFDTGVRSVLQRAEAEVAAGKPKD